MEAYDGEGPERFVFADGGEDAPPPLGISTPDRQSMLWNLQRASAGSCSKVARMASSTALLAETNFNAGH